MLGPVDTGSVPLEERFWRPVLVQRGRDDAGLPFKVRVVGRLAQGDSVCRLIALTTAATELATAASTAATAVVDGDRLALLRSALRLRDDLDRHGDASLPFPRTPLWRWLRVRARGVRGYRFGA